MRVRKTKLLCLLALSTLIGASNRVPAQAETPDKDKTPAEKLLKEQQDIAFIGVHVYTVDAKTGKSKVLKGVTVLVEDGKFSKIGKDLDVPSSFERVEGGVLVPGLVYAGSTAGLRSTRGRRPQRTIPIEIRRRFRGRIPQRTSGRSTFNPTAKVSSKIKADDEVFVRLLRAGVTTLGVRPLESGISGQGAVIRSAGRNAEDLLIKDEALLYIGMRSDTATKKMLRENFEKAKELIKKREEEKKKAAEAAKKAAAAAKPAAGAAKPGTPKKEPPKKEPPKKEPPKKEPPKKEPPKKEPPKKEPDKKGKPAGKPQGAAAKKPAKPQKPKEDPKIAVLAKVVEGKLPVLLNIGSIGGPANLLHALDALEETEFEITVVHIYRRGARDTLDLLIPKLKEKKASVIVPAELAFVPQTQHYKSPVARLKEAGVRVMLVPGSSKTELETIWFRLNELHRAGIARADLVAALTYEPSRFLGVEKQVGSISEGKDANLLHFTRDPFSPAARLEQVYFEGKPVENIKTRN